MTQGENNDTVARTHSVHGGGFDFKDTESALDPYPRWKELRESQPVSYSEKYGGFFVVSQYRDITRILRDWQTFSSADKTTIPELPIPNMPPVEYDPPDQRIYRKLINPWFSPASVGRYEPWIRQLAADLLAPLLERESFDVVREFALPLGRTVVMELMGITEYPPELVTWVAQILDLRAIDDEQVGRAAEGVLSFLDGEIQKRRHNPGDDFISSMCAATFDGRPLEHEEILLMSRLVLSAGLETTKFALGSSVRYLIEHPGARARLSTDPDVWDLAIEEFLRWGGPVAGVVRTVHKDMTVGGCPMHAGSKVWLLLQSGNHDESEIEDPETLILDRDPNRHLGFGLGPHRCAGSHLGKAMLRVGLQTLLPHMETWEIDADATQWVARETRGLGSLQIVRSGASAPST